MKATRKIFYLALQLQEARVHDGRTEETRAGKEAGRAAEPSHFELQARSRGKKLEVFESLHSQILTPVTQSIKANLLPTKTVPPTRGSSIQIPETMDNSFKP